MSPLVLLPGLLCDATVWAPQKEAFAGELRVTAFRHFYGYNSLNSMAAAVLDAAPSRFALAGHSMGGRVALEIMRLAPERVEPLALFDTRAAPASAAEPNPRPGLIEFPHKESMEGLAQRWLP